MSISAGRLNRRITIERATVTTNDLNEPVKAWGEIGDRWAAREDVSDAEMIAAGELGASLGARFTVRRDELTETITPADRLTHDGAVWNIKAVREKRDAPRAFLEIRAAREV